VWLANGLARSLCRAVVNAIFVVIISELSSLFAPGRLVPPMLVTSIDGSVKDSTDTKMTIGEPHIKLFEEMADDVIVLDAGLLGG
jgi:hypothetical protein